MDLTPSTPRASSNPAPGPGDGGTAAGSAGRGGKVSSNRDIAVVQADYLALANDLEQAQSLASTLELQLSGKTNELAQFKVIWERTQADLIKFAQDLDAMRKERHSLANEAQRGYAFELKFQRLQVSHEELVKKVDRLESELAAERSAHEQTRAELAQAKEQRPRPLPAGPGPRGAADPELRLALETLREQLERVLGGRVFAAQPAVKPAPEHIDIEFGT